MNNIQKLTKLKLTEQQGDLVDNLIIQVTPYFKANQRRQNVISNINNELAERYDKANIPQFKCYFGDGKALTLINGKTATVPAGIKDIYLNRNMSNHLDKLGFKELRSKDRKGSYFAVNKDIFNEIVSPICPDLAFLSSPSSPSSQLHINSNKKGDDSITISDDKKEKDVTMVTICDESDDVNEEQDKIIFSEEDLKNSNLDQDLIKKTIEEVEANK